jgi:hypothetical protein
MEQLYLPGLEFTPGDLFWQAYYPRLSEAIYRFRDEPLDHTFRAIAEEELEELRAKALSADINEGEFSVMCSTAYDNPWQDEEGQTYIETEEGHDRYFGPTTLVIGEGQLPPGTESVKFLMEIGSTVMAFSDQNLNNNEV